MAATAIRQCSPQQALNLSHDMQDSSDNKTDKRVTVSFVEEMIDVELPDTSSSPTLSSKLAQASSEDPTDPTESATDEAVTDDDDEGNVTSSNSYSTLKSGESVSDSVSETNCTHSVVKNDNTGGHSAHSSDFSSMSQEAGDSVIASKSPEIGCAVFGCLSKAEKLSPASQLTMCSTHYQRDVDQLKVEVSQLNKVFMEKTRPGCSYLKARSLLQKRVSITEDLESEIVRVFHEIETKVKEKREAFQTRFANQRRFLYSDITKLNSDVESIISKGAQLRILMEVESYDQAYSLLSELKHVLHSNFDMKLTDGLTCNASSLRSLTDRVVKGLDRIHLVEDSSTEPFNQFTKSLEHSLTSIKMFTDSVQYVVSCPNTGNYGYMDMGLSAFGVSKSIVKMGPRNRNATKLSSSGFLLNFNVKRDLILFLDSELTPFALIDLSKLLHITLSLAPPFALDTKSHTLFVMVVYNNCLYQTDFAGMILTEINTFRSNCFSMRWDPNPVTHEKATGCLSLFMNKKSAVGNKLVKIGAFNDYTDNCYIFRYLTTAKGCYLKNKIGPVNAVDFASTFEYSYILSAAKKSITVYSNTSLNLVKVIPIDTDSLLVEVDVDPRGVLFVKNIRGAISCCNMHKNAAVIAQMHIASTTETDIRFHSFKRLVFHEGPSGSRHLLTSDNTGKSVAVYTFV